MSVTVVTGDFHVAIRDLPDASFDAIIADPPYGQTSLRWDYRSVDWPSYLRRLLKPSGSMWVFGTLRYFMETATEFRGWKMSHDVVWEKHNGAGFANDRFRGVHELAAHFYRDDARWGGVFRCPQYSNDATARTIRRKERPAHWTGARGPSSYVSEDGGPRLERSVVFAHSEHGHAQHPTQKPVALVEMLLRYACPVGGAVLDPFAGSGTTGLAARRIGADATLIELNPEYVAVIEQRLREDAPLLSQVSLFPSSLDGEKWDSA